VSYEVTVAITTGGLGAQEQAGTGSAGQAK
jgi:hypothetical protein